MDIGTWLMVALQLSAYLFCLYWVLQCYLKFPTKRWRFLALAVWMGFALLIQAAAVTFILLTPQEPSTVHLQYLHWLNRTSTIIGYLAVGTTCWVTADYYRGQGYG